MKSCYVVNPMAPAGVTARPPYVKFLCGPGVSQKPQIQRDSSEFKKIQQNSQHFATIGQSALCSLFDALKRLVNHCFDVLCFIIVIDVEFILCRIISVRKNTLILMRTEAERHTGCYADSQWGTTW